MFGLASHFCNMNTAAARLETERYQKTAQDHKALAQKALNELNFWILEN